MAQERKRDEPMVREEEKPPGLSEEGIQFLNELQGNGQPQITKGLRIQFGGAGGYLNKAHVAIQRYDFNIPEPRTNRDRNPNELKQTRFIAINVLCPILYPEMPISEALGMRNRIEGLHQRIMTFRNIFYTLSNENGLSPQEISMIPQLIDFMRGLQTQYPALKEQYDRVFNNRK